MRALPSNMHRSALLALPPAVYEAGGGVSLPRRRPPHSRSSALTGRSVLRDQPASLPKVPAGKALTHLPPSLVIQALPALKSTLGQAEKFRVDLSAVSLRHLSLHQGLQQ